VSEATDFPQALVYVSRFNAGIALLLSRHRDDAPYARFARTRRSRRDGVCRTVSRRRRATPRPPLGNAMANIRSEYSVVGAAG
jgi:hypothetical protein